MSCNSCQQELYQTLGWNLWIPQSEGYNLNAVVINPGDSNLYISLVDSNVTLPAQPGSQWAIVTVAQLIEGSPFLWANLGYLPWSSTTAYSANQGVIHNGTICISNVPGTNTNIGNEPPDSPGYYTYWGVYATYETYQRAIMNPPA